MKAEEIAQWVIDNRYAKNENQKISDIEMYHTLVEKITSVWSDKKNEQNILKNKSMEIKIKTIDDSLTIRENGGLMEITMTQDNNFCVMFIDKNDAKKIGQKLIEWSDKREIIKKRIKQA